MLTKVERHDLLVLTREGREEAWTRREPAQEAVWDCWRRYPSVPAIFTGRMDEKQSDLLRVGFSFPRRVGHSRCRMAACLSQGAIETVITPWMAAEQGSVMDGPAGDLLRRLQAAADCSGVKLGLFGAASLQIVTRLPYLHSRSDLDIVIRAPSSSALYKFWAMLTEIELRSDIRVDAELRISKTQYVKCRELFSLQHTVLVKGGAAPQLLSHRTVWDSIQNG